MLQRLAPVRSTSIRTFELPLAGLALSTVLLSGFVTLAAHDESHFSPDNLVVSRSVYVGDAGTVVVGQTLPPGCVPGTVHVPLLGGGTTPVTVTCAKAIADGTYPTVFNNAPSTVDGSFGVTAPIFSIRSRRAGGGLIRLRLTRGRL
jgi:hypothetical protein